MDKDGSGTIDTKELLEALDGSGLNEKLVKEFIDEHDKDHDGKLNLNELRDFLASCGCL